MINKEEYLNAGVINKPRGIAGELNFACHPLIHLNGQEFPFLFLETDGYLVPYRIEDMFWSDDTRGSVKFEDIHTSEDAAKITGTDFYVPKEDLTEDNLETSFGYLTGFSVLDANGHFVGTVTGFMDIPGNPVLVLDTANGEILLPFNEDLVINFDPKEKRIEFEIPEGLLNLD